MQKELSIGERVFFSVIGFGGALLLVQIGAVISLLIERSCGPGTCIRDQLLFFIAWTMFWGFILSIFSVVYQLSSGINYILLCWWAIGATAVGYGMLGQEKVLGHFFPWEWAWNTWSIMVFSVVAIATLAQLLEYDDRSIDPYEPE